MKPLLTMHANAFGSAGHYCIVATAASGSPRRETLLGESAIMGIGSSENVAARLHNFGDKPFRLAELGIASYQVFADWESSEHLPQEREKFLRSIFAIAHGQFPALDALQAGGDTAYILRKKPANRRFSKILQEAVAFVCRHSDMDAEMRIKQVLGEHEEWRSWIVSNGGMDSTAELCDIGLILQPSDGYGRAVTHIVPVATYTTANDELVWVWERSETGWKRCEVEFADEYLKRTIF